MIQPRRVAARSLGWMAQHGLQVLAVLIAAILAWSALAHWHGAPNTALDYASRVLSILSVGRLTPHSNRILLASWEIALALCLMVPRLSRATLWLAAPRVILGLLPLFMLSDDLSVASKQTTAAYAVLLLTIWIISARQRWAILQNDLRVRELVEIAPLSPQQRALRRTQVLARLGAAIVLFAVGRAAWPSYLRWFHARQEAAVLDEKLSGKLVPKSMPLSPLLKRKITTWVYLPPGYNRLSVRYPVVYVMHGMPGEVRDCFVKGQIHNAAEELILGRKIKPMILVGWDGQGPNGPNDITNFLDRADGSWPMESFMVKELVPYIDRTYRTIARPEARALCGVSAGGYAAVNLMFKHPEVWKIGASHTGFFDPADDADNMTDILGPKGLLWVANNPLKTVAQISPAQNLHVYADIGQSDQLSAEFSQFCAQLQSKNMDHECHVFPGRHTWEYWSTHFYDSLRFIDARFDKMGVPQMR